MVHCPIARLAEHMEDIWGFAVATAEEGEALRKGGITKPILILGYTFPESYGDLVRLDIRPAVFTKEMAQALSDEAQRPGKDCTRSHCAGYGHEPYRL